MDIFLKRRVNRLISNILKVQEDKNEELLHTWFNIIKGELVCDPTSTVDNCTICEGAKLIVGKNSSVSGVALPANTTMIVGDNCKISYVHINTTSSMPIEIGNNCVLHIVHCFHHIKIADNSYVLFSQLASVSIGENSVFVLSIVNGLRIAQTEDRPYCFVFGANTVALKYRIVIDTEGTIPNVVNGKLSVQCGVTIGNNAIFIGQPHLILKKAQNPVTSPDSQLSMAYMFRNRDANMSANDINVPTGYDVRFPIGTTTIGDDFHMHISANIKNVAVIGTNVTIGNNVTFNVAEAMAGNAAPADHQLCGNQYALDIYALNITLGHNSIITTNDANACRTICEDASKINNYVIFTIGDINVGIGANIIARGSIRAQHSDILMVPEHTTLIL